MNKAIAGLLLLLGLASPALAQRVQNPQNSAAVCAFNTSPPTLISGWFGYIQCDATGKLIISGGGGGGGGLSVIDGATFTAGTSPFTPSGCEYNSTIAALTSGTQGMVRCNQYRAWVVDVDTTNNNLYAALTSPSVGLAATAYNTNTYTNATNSALNTDLNGNLFTNDSVSRWGGSTLGAPSNYGTSPGAVAVPGVNANVTNTVATSGAVNVTATDCSGTVATGGTAVNAFTAQTTLHGFTIVNTDTTEVMWISFTTTAAAATAGSYPIPNPTATTFAGGGSYSSPAGFGLNHALSVVAATNGHKFSCTWW